MKPKNPKPVIKAIRRVTQSPLNEVIWYFDLECGHETTAVCKSRPTRQTIKCPTCTAAAAKV